MNLFSNNLSLSSVFGIALSGRLKSHFSLRSYIYNPGKPTPMHSFYSFVTFCDTNNTLLMLNIPTEVGRYLWGLSGPIPLLKQGELSRFSNTASSWLLNIIKDGDWNQPLWKTCSNVQLWLKSLLFSCLKVCAPWHWSPLRVWVQPFCTIPSDTYTF